MLPKIAAIIAAAKINVLPTDLREFFFMIPVNKVKAGLWSLLSFCKKPVATFEPDPEIAVPDN